MAPKALLCGQHELTLLPTHCGAAYVKHHDAQPWSGGNVALHTNRKPPAVNNWLN